MIPLTKKHQPQYEACERVNTQVGTDGPPTERVIFGFRYSSMSGVVFQKDSGCAATGIKGWFPPQFIDVLVRLAAKVQHW